MPIDLMLRKDVKAIGWNGAFGALDACHVHHHRVARAAQQQKL
jgi:hypothetical protein